MLSASSTFICYLEESEHYSKNLFSAINYKESKSIIGVKDPIKKNIIEDYFVNEGDLSQVRKIINRDSKIFEFDHVYNNNLYRLI